MSESSFARFVRKTNPGVSGGGFQIALAELVGLSFVFGGGTTLIALSGHRSAPVRVLLILAGVAICAATVAFLVAYLTVAIRQWRSRPRTPQERWDRLQSAPGRGSDEGDSGADSGRHHIPQRG